MVISRIIALFLVFISLDSFAQTEEIDRLFRYSKFKELDTLLFQSNEKQGIDIKLAQVKYFNSFKRLEESFTLLFDMDTTAMSTNQKAYYYHSLAKAYDLNVNYDISVSNYKKAQKYYKQIGDLKSFNSINLDLYYSMLDTDIYSQSNDYLKEYQELAYELNDPLQLANLELELAFTCDKNEDSTSHYLTHIKKAYKYVDLDQDPYTLSVIHSFHAFYYTDIIVQKDSAEFYYNKALKLNKQLGLSHKTALTYYSLGDINSMTGDYEKAIYWTKKANSLRNFNYDYDLTAYINETLAEDYKQLNQLDSAYFYLSESLRYRDSLNYQKQNINLTRFEAEKKERENLKLERENKQNRTYIIGSLGALALLMILSGLVYINSKRKRLLVEKDKALEIQKIEEQLKQQELKALDALVIGQEKERMRLASDLHDNIGANFMVIRSYFNHLHKEYEASPVSAKVFDKTQNLLEETYQDIRALAHLKHSGLLKNSELIPAIEKLCKKVSSFSKIEVEFNSFIEGDIKLDDKLELNVFRIVQEATANIVKHAQATTATISLTRIDSILNIIIEDDGIGFDEHQTHTKDSLGLESIKQRVDLLKGNFKIDTKEGRGTTLIFDIPI